MDQPIGPLLEKMGVTVNLDDNEHLTEALVIAKVVEFDSGETRLSVCSNGVDWISQIGLIHAAARISEAGIEQVQEP